MRALILPGMDGSGRLLRGFVEALAPEISADVAAYPPTRVLGYDSLLALVHARVPRDEPFLLIGESFSGPLAIRIAAASPQGLAGLVLCASFASSPQPWFGPLGPILRLPFPKPPVELLMPLMMGRWKTPEWTQLERQALDPVTSQVARRRLSEVLRVDARDALARVHCPVLYLQANHDRLVPRRCWRDVQRILPQARRVCLDGPHFILQHQPVEAALAIKQKVFGDRGKR